ncbi:hypothetical protein HK102_014019 [Quaeritorhiza haematococci]|nr:hypothetical protein HK102_014019 [Quaeritorhiza haematococci]
MSTATPALSVALLTWNAALNKGISVALLTEDLLYCLRQVILKQGLSYRNVSFSTISLSFALNIISLFLGTLDDSKVTSNKFYFSHRYLAETSKLLLILFAYQFVYMGSTLLTAIGKFGVDSYVSKLLYVTLLAAAGITIADMVVLVPNYKLYVTLVATSAIVLFFPMQLYVSWLIWSNVRDRSDTFPSSNDGISANATVGSGSSDSKLKSEKSQTSTGGSSKKNLVDGNNKRTIETIFTISLVVLYLIFYLVGTNISDAVWLQFFNFTIRSLFMRQYSRYNTRVVDAYFANKANLANFSNI